MASNIIVKIKNASQEIQSYQIKTGTGKVLHIQASPDVTYQLIDEATGLGPTKIVVKRVGDDLLISFEPEDIASGQLEHPDIIIENYYTQGDCLVVGQQPNGELFSYLPESNEVALSIPELAHDVSAVEILGGTALSADKLFWLNPKWLLALASIGVVAVAASGGHGGKGGG